MTHTPDPADLTALRGEIDRLDEQLVDAFTRRMAVCAAIADYKREHALPVTDAARERALLARVAELAGQELAEYTRTLYATVLSASRSYQRARMGSRSARLRVGLLGASVAHSWSPRLHAAFADYAYRLYEVPPAELAAFFAAGDFDALNVTMPYKQAVIPFLQELSPLARRIGAVNTLWRRPDGSLYGDNTDYAGFACLLDTAGMDVTGKKVLVLGSGGASRTVQAVLADRRAGEVTVISRTGENHYENIGRHADAQILINTTPVGMYPHGEGCPVDLDVFPALQGVADVIYNPLRTALVGEARRRGIPAVGGLTMLVAQAAAACERFTGDRLPDGAIDRVRREVEAERRNIVLIGMPGCGKSVAGAELARQMGRAFVDLDAVVTERTGHTPEEILTADGETAFRQAEHETVCAVGQRTGLVIATGGGVVTRPDNYQPLAQNGVLICLRRDAGELATAGRPLSQGDPAALARQREGLYRRFSDAAVEVAPDPAVTVRRILEVLA